MKVIVLGAGIIGVTTAYYLNKLGYEVTVIERKNVSAAECSFANGGQLSYSHAEPWASPAALRKIPKWLISAHSPLVFRPSADINMWKWALSFLGRCTDKKKEEATEDTLRLALYSRECFADIMKDTGIEFSYLNHGTVHTFRHEEALAANIAQAEFQKQLGCDYEILHTRADCEKKEPALKYSPTKIIGGIFFPLDATGDVNQFSINLTDYLINKGVKFVYGQTVKEIIKDGDRITGIVTDKSRYDADNFVMSLGASSPVLLRKIGINVPIYPMKGYSLSIAIKDMEKTPLAGITDQYNKIVYSRLGNILRVAGTAEFAGYDDSVNKERLATLKKMVYELFPHAGDVENAKEWSCLRPSTPEGTPILGKTGYNNFYLNTGHGTLGWTLSAGSANIVADIISSKEPEIDLKGLTMEKYS